MLHKHNIWDRTIIALEIGAIISVCLPIHHLSRAQYSECSDVIYKYIRVCYKHYTYNQWTINFPARLHMVNFTHHLTWTNTLHWHNTLHFYLYIRNMWHVIYIYRELVRSRQWWYFLFRVLTQQKICNISNKNHHIYTKE